MTAVNFAQRSMQSELMDSETVDFAEFHQCLRQLTIVNVFTLAYRPTLRWLGRTVRYTMPRDTVSVLDVGSGGGDMLRKIWKLLQRRDLNPELTGVDLNPWSKQSAEADTPQEMNIRYETSNVFSLDQSRRADFIISCNFTHHLTDAEQLSQGFVAVPIPAPGTAGRELAEMIAASLDGPGGLLAPALADATTSVRIMGGVRAPALVIDVRAPEGGLAQALADVKALLLRLATTAAEADLSRAYSAWERREQEARTDPRRRLVDLWSGRRDLTVGRPALATFRAALAALLREGAMIVVEGRL